jgi:hypothetical protein
MGVRLSWIDGSPSKAVAPIKHPLTLNKRVSENDKLDWYGAGLGDHDDGLWKKKTEEKISTAGQSFTPRPLINAMVAVMQPKRGMGSRIRPLERMSCSSPTNLTPNATRPANASSASLRPCWPKPSAAS